MAPWSRWRWTFCGFTAVSAWEVHENCSLWGCCFPFLLRTMLSLFNIVNFLTSVFTQCAGGGEVRKSSYFETTFAFCWSVWWWRISSAPDSIHSGRASSSCPSISTFMSIIGCWSQDFCPTVKPYIASTQSSPSQDWQDLAEIYHNRDQGNLVPPG